jgi:hypothetical protein
MIKNSNQKQNKSQIPHEYKVGDQCYWKDPEFSRNCQRLLQDHIL